MTTPRHSTPAEGTPDDSDRSEPPRPTVRTPAATEPLVTAVVPAFQAADTIGATLTGLLTQSYPDIEVLVVDDGSSDATAEVASSHGERVRVIRQQNAGVSSARNAGAAAARGSLLVFCDSDDVLLPPAVEAMVRAWREAGAGRRIVSCNAYPLTVEGIAPDRARVMEFFPAPERQRQAILATNFVSTIALIPRDVFDELGGYDTTLPVAEDWDLWLRAIYGGVEIVFERRPLALYRWRRGSLSSDGERMLTGEESVFRRFVETEGLDLSAQEREILQDRLDHGSPWRSRAAGDRALRSGDARTAARQYRRAAGFIRHDRRLRLRAWSLTLAPASAGLWRRRDRRIDEATGLSESGPGAGSPPS